MEKTIKIVWFKTFSHKEHLKLFIDGNILMQ